MATRDELYAKFGTTAEAAQLLETELGILLIIAFGLEHDLYAKPDREKALKHLRDVDRKTLGQLLNKLKDYFDFDDELVVQFDLALSARNRLNHGFYERHNYAIQSDEGRDAMVADLEALHQELFKAWEAAGVLTTICYELLRQTREDVPEFSLEDPTTWPKRPTLPDDWPRST
jgi:hypothetical protein